MILVGIGIDKEWPLGPKPTTMGRHPANNVQVLDPIVSKEHCEIRYRNYQYELHDLGSLNGTFLNGQRVEGIRVLRPGDTIRLGTRNRTFQVVESRSHAYLPEVQATDPDPPPRKSGLLGWLRRIFRQ